MDGSQFDRLARKLGETRTRRGVAAFLAAAGTLPLLGIAGAEARKKKKKKCKAPKVKCGKKCLAASSCCTDADCGGNGVCQGTACSCFVGFHACGGTCIADGACCSDADCGVGVCANGDCRCLSGQKACGEKCIPASACCADADCGSPCKTCQNNVCRGGCSAGQTCLANGSCGKTCATHAECSNNGTCICDAPGHVEFVCHVISPTVCDDAPDCNSTVDCPKGTECSNACPQHPRCLALCGV